MSINKIHDSNEKTQSLISSNSSAEVLDQETFSRFIREALSSLKPNWHCTKEIQEAMMLFLGQEPQQMNLYIIVGRWCTTLKSVLYMRGF